MKIVKLFIVLIAALVAISACNQSTTTPSTTTNTNTNTNTSRTAANTAVNSGSNVVTVAKTGENSSFNKNRDSIRAAMAEDEPVEGPSADLYKENCMICHKETGKGGKLTLEGKTITPADLTSARMQAKSDVKLFNEIKDGVPDEGMPGFAGKLSDEDIRTIVKHIRTLK